MRKYSDTDIRKARELRLKGKYSFAQLQRLTGIPSSTLRNWCNDISIGTKWDTLINTNLRKREELKKSEITALSSLKALDEKFLKILCSLLYWCEGSKYPSSNKVSFTNSDPTLIKLFVTLLRKSFPLNEFKFTVRLQLHESHNFNKLRKYWSGLLKISEKQFLKPTVTKANGGKHRSNYLGTCTVVYGDYKVQLKLIGLYEEFAKLFDYTS